MNTCSTSTNSGQVGTFGEGFHLEGFEPCLASCRRQGENSCSSSIPEQGSGFGFIEISSSAAEVGTDHQNALVAARVEEA